MVGASGAIAAVMAGYLVLYPRSPITVLNPIPLLWFFMGIFWEFPAWIIALEFFGINLWSGLNSLGPGGHGMGGVAFFAHIGGFVTGLILIGLFTRGRERKPSTQWSGWRPPQRRSSGWERGRGRW
jgi:membrane associated rhomboid family serine protease